MKNRLIITISDINGSKQYSVHEIIKEVIGIIVLVMLLIGVGTYLYIIFLHDKVSTLDTQKVAFQRDIKKLEITSETYKKKNTLLNKQNSRLSFLIQESSDKLSSVNEKLEEVEEMIGFGPDLNASFHTRLEVEREQLTQKLKKELKNQQMSSIQKTLLLNSIPNGKPLKYARVSSPYGYRIHPITHKQSFHPAIDLKAKKGTPIYAPASGVVVLAKRKGGYGKFVLIAHSYGFKTAYGHLSKFAVHSGQYVNKGDLIAYVGSTGRSTGPHLHYEIRYLDKWLNPKPFIKWNLENINNISDKISQVNWKSILIQIQKLITLSTQIKEEYGTFGEKK